MQPNFRKRRHGAAVNKNELKITREENEKQRRAASGTLRSRFPQVQAVQLEFRMEATTGAILEESSRAVSLDEPLVFDVACQGGCSGGVFLLTDALTTAIAAGQEERDGMGICQRPSYRDSNLPCNTKFYYHAVIRY